MTTRIQGLSAVIDRYDVLLVDLWGCVHNGVAPFPAAVDALTRARQAGVKVCLLSNGPRRLGPIIERLDEMGVPRACYGDIVTSGEATWSALAAPSDAFHKGLGPRCFWIGPARDVSAASATVPESGYQRVDRLEDADFVVVTGPYENADKIEDYDAALDAALRLKLPMVCANPDLVVHVGEELIICAGLIAERYEAKGGAVSYHGKPYASVYDMCFEKLGDPDRARTLGIGDNLRTDVAGAKAVGADALFLAGGIYVDIFGTEDPTPEAVRAQAMAEGQPQPEFVLPKLAW